ncbi:L,D-transpeptidase [Streptomyces cirratus]|uniref:L,D-transpeptidase n=1 Tax=Streptomyces cirratus TaxID=68187 RepID=UPI00167DD36A|nr:L,D-transpeptidase [Streptomyces cirratus]
MARSSSGIVAGLTVAALAAVGFLGYQASATAPARPAKAAPQAPAPAPGPARPDPSKPAAVPADSGTGVRVVYSVSQKRVWLVGEDGQEPKSFAVVPSTVHPVPGSYPVGSRSGTVTGSDGVPIEHVVRFATTDGIAIGFSARVDGALPQPDQTKKTGGIRMSRADGDAMWAFATINTKVVVVP